MERFPDAREAFLDQQVPLAKKGDIGIENAAPESIREALFETRAFFDCRNP